MGRALKVCTGRPGKRCTALVAKGRCPDCSSEADRDRGTATQRGYNSAGHRRFRRAVLARDIFCVLGCGSMATVADHYPDSRRELVEQGLNPDDPARGRGLCKPCHDSQTSQHQPGGWAAR
jgi:5-methylcytosine-specific restriction enzyme A